MDHPAGETEGDQENADDEVVDDDRGPRAIQPGHHDDDRAQEDIHEPDRVADLSKRRDGDRDRQRADIKLQNGYRHPRFIATVPGQGYRFIPTFSNAGWDGAVSKDA